jgi:large subunit ribosomal protein L3
MSVGIVGVKRGMTRVFSEDGASIPVTVIEAQPNRVTRRKTVDSDGYDAVQVTFGNVKASRVNKAKAGQFSKANVDAGRNLFEFRCDPETGINTGDAVNLEGFEPGQKIDVTGTSKGKGFAGVIKRHNFSHQDYTHGNSISHRAPGSIGQCQTPGRVFKGKKMAGHMGSVRVTTQNLEVVRVDLDNHLLLVKGAVPGATGTDVIVRPAVKGNR